MGAMGPGRPAEFLSLPCGKASRQEVMDGDIEGDIGCVDREPRGREMT